MTELPDSVEALAAAALAEVQADPQHRLAPRRRQAIYAALASAPEGVLAAAPNWLAVLAALHVLPLFQAHCPEDELPPALLATAIGVLEGKLDGATAGEMEARGYQAMRNAWGYEDDELPWPVGLAADAAYHALKETLGHKPLADVAAVLRRGTVALQSSDRPAAPVPPKPGNEDVQDEALCQMDNTDTASIAAVAAASSEFGPTCDPERLLVFWTWWLREALPEAVAAARRAKP